MTRNEINEKLNKVFQEAFDDDCISVTETTTASDIDGWDSIAHLTLVSDVEEAFGIEFTLGEINGFKNVGEMMDSIQKHISKI